ncbi:hypothetical protein MTO96_023155 [Rhipicephalus appendiculatus]
MKRAANTIAVERTLHGNGSRTAIFKLSSMHEEAVDVIAAQLRSSYQQYRNISGKYTAFLTTTNTPEGQKELDMLGAIDADRDAIVKEKLREAMEHTYNGREESALKRSLLASSRASSVTQRSGSSTMSLAATQARAQADAVKARGSLQP